MEQLQLNPDSRGLAVIITIDYADYLHHPTLSGTSVDGERLEEAFVALHFDVYWKRNVVGAQLIEIVQEIRNLQFGNVKHYKCIVFVFSGHGESPDKLVMQNGEKMSTWGHLISPVLPGNAPSIGDIPKIFIIDACRGKNETETALVPDIATCKGNASGVNSEPDTARRKGGYSIQMRELPREGNFLVAYLTLPDCLATDYSKGSLWLEILASKLSIDSQLSLDDTLTQVNKELMEKCQKERGYVFQQPEKLGRLNDILYLGRDPTTTDVAFTGMSKP